MDDIKASAAQHHEEAASQFELVAKMHHDAAKQCSSGNFEKAERLATSAAESSTVADRHAMEALDLYRHHAEEAAAVKAEADKEESARAARREAKASASD